MFDIILNSRRLIEVEVRCSRVRCPPFGTPSPLDFAIHNSHSLFPNLCIT